MFQTLQDAIKNKKTMKKQMKRQEKKLLKVATRMSFNNSDRS